MEVILINCSTIMAVKIDNRNEDAPKFQEVITRHGCIIKTRLGIHEVDECSRNGLILLQLCGDEEKIKTLKEEVNKLNSIKAKWLNLDF